MRAVLTHAAESFGFTLAAAACAWAITALPNTPNLPPQAVAMLPFLTAALRAAQKWLQSKSGTSSI